MPLKEILKYDLFHKRGIYIFIISNFQRPGFPVSTAQGYCVLEASVYMEFLMQMKQVTSKDVHIKHQVIAQVRGARLQSATK